MSNDKIDNKIIHRTSIGGQAVIEGVMMRGPEKAVIAVRKPDGEIEVVDLKVASQKDRKKIYKRPIIRGVVSFIESMTLGYKALMKSAEIAGLEDEEPSKFEKWLSDKTGKNLMDVVSFIALVIGLAFSVGLFVIVPLAIVSYISKYIALGNYLALVQGTLKVIIFLLYLFLISNLKSIRRVFQYHGAEHKTIHCYEAGEELSIENVKKHTRLHPRCGTSFLLIVLMLSIAVFYFIPFKVQNIQNILLRLLSEIALLPVIAGISYEAIKYAGRHDNVLTKILSFPGTQLQRLTTREPDDAQLWVAIESLKAVLTDNKEDDKW